MYSSIQKNSLAQLGLGLQLGMAARPLIINLTNGTWQSCRTRPGTIAICSRVTLLALRSLIYKGSLEKLPTLFSTFNDGLLHRFSSHLSLNRVGLRGYRWLPEFDARRIGSVCEKLYPVAQNAALIALFVLNVRGHQMAKIGAFTTFACQQIGLTFGYGYRVNQIMGLASQCLIFAANPVPVLTLWSISKCICALEDKSIAEIKQSAERVYRSTLGLFQQPKRSLGQLCSFVSEGLRNYLDQTLNA